MKLILCVKRDLHGCVFLNRLLPQLAGHEAWVLFSHKTRPAELEMPALAELAFLERGLPVDLLFPLLDAAGGAGAEWLGFDALLRRHELAGETVDDINDPALVRRMAAFGPDLIVSARFSHILKPPAIAVARHGVLNIHPGELPGYAGLFAPMRMIAEGRGELCCAMHFIDAGIDSGPLVDVQRLPYRPDEGLLTQIAEVYPLAIPALLDLMARVERGLPVPATTQDRRLRRYRSLPDAAEVTAFLAAGHRFWQPTAYEALLQRFMPVLPEGLPLAALAAKGGFRPWAG